MITGNEPAYPTNEETTYIGLTIRQQFAMAAMQGLAAALWACDSKACAKKSVEYADALITELNKEKS